MYSRYRKVHLPTVEYNLTASSGHRMQLPLATLGKTLTYTKKKPHFLALVFFFSLSLFCPHSLSIIQGLRTHTVQGARVIYLEPIVNSSLRLNENVDRELQKKKMPRQTQGIQVKIFQVTAHYSQLLGRQLGGREAGVGERLGAKGGEDATV